MRKLPWHLWDVLQKYPYVEVALSAPDAERGERIYRDKARILVVLGDSTDINVEADRELLQEYCKNGEIILLKEPSRETLIDHLRDNAGWDILFFSGHSRTDMLISWNFNLDDLLVRGCKLIEGYLENDPDVSPGDKNLCGLSSLR
ncbi:MAG: hypothetical protein KME29_34025 [Calothrix sp. FI2-JRJ7]|nr:hypothetical protein [Calothrix sp. FI2-JRJ7]